MTYGSKINIVMVCTGAAFEDYDSSEVARILRELADRYDGHPYLSAGFSEPIKDIDGNTCGTTWVE